jgi:hypothetical protein
MNTDMELHNKTNLGLIIFAASLVTPYIGISDVNAIFPFDQFISPETNKTVNQSSQDPFTNLPGEHGESPNEKDTVNPFD